MGGNISAETGIRLDLYKGLMKSDYMFELSNQKPTDPMRSTVSYAHAWPSK